MPDNPVREQPRSKEHHIALSKSICQNIRDVYVPEGYSYKSSVLACGFPTKTSSLSCRNFLSFIGPVIYVERQPSLANRNNFLVVFASDDWAERALMHTYPFNELGFQIACRPLDVKLNSWNLPKWLGSS